MRNILITGVASGIGNAVMNYFLMNNYNVIGVDIKEIEKRENLIGFTCDITNKAELEKVKEFLIDNNIVLDAIVNIAGIHKMASLVEDDFSKIKKVIDINLCGTMLVNNVFHSILDKKGRILIVTSEVATFDPMPFNGLYNVSKTALECYAQALRQELNLIGQKVITIRPGAIETNLSSGSLVDTEELSHNTILYKKQATKFVSITKKFMGKPLKPERLGKLIYKIANKKNPKISYKIHQNIGLVLLNLLPKRLQCFIIKFILN
jgi:short-subunit dehydrogenase